MIQIPTRPLLIDDTSLTHPLHSFSFSRFHCSDADSNGVDQLTCHKLNMSLSDIYIYSSLKRYYDRTIPFADLLRIVVRIKSEEFSFQPLPVSFLTPQEALSVLQNHVDNPAVIIIQKQISHCHQGKVPVIIPLPEDSIVIISFLKMMFDLYKGLLQWRRAEVQQNIMKLGQVDQVHILEFTQNIDTLKLIHALEPFLGKSTYLCRLLESFINSNVVIDDENGIPQNYNLADLSPIGMIHMGLLEMFFQEIIETYLNTNQILFYRLLHFIIIPSLSNNTQIFYEHLDSIGLTFNMQVLDKREKSEMTLLNMKVTIDENGWLCVFKQNKTK